MEYSINYSDLKSDAANRIIEAVKFSYLVANQSTGCGIEIVDSLYLNIRDAMFHYKALENCCRKDDADGVLRNYYNLIEHINRGIKDEIKSFAQSICSKTMYLLQLETFYENIYDEDLREIRKQCHVIKNLILDIRTHNSNLSEKDDISITWQKIVAAANIIIDIARNYNLELF